MDRTPIDILIPLMDALPEQHLALATEAGRVAYREASARLLAVHGWDDNSFLDALSERILAANVSAA